MKKRTYILLAFLCAIAAHFGWEAADGISSIFMWFIQFFSTFFQAQSV
jgi:hypothetical protein